MAWAMARPVIDANSMEQNYYLNINSVSES
jgi:hypothetical protein